MTICRPLKRGVTILHDLGINLPVLVIFSVSLKSTMNISEIFLIVNHGRRRRMDSRIKSGSKTTAALPRERIFLISEFT